MHVLRVDIGSVFSKVVVCVDQVVKAYAAFGAALIGWERISSVKFSPEES